MASVNRIRYKREACARTRMPRFYLLLLLSGVPPPPKVQRLIDGRAKLVTTIFTYCDVRQECRHTAPETSD